MATSIETLQAIGRPTALQEAENKKQTAADIGDRFLKLLVTQMRNQDPLNPLENAEVTSQLAQISTVTGVDKLNATIEALSQVITSQQTMQATSMVGRSVLAPGQVLELGADGALAAMDLKEAASIVNVEILDKYKAVVDSMQLKDRPAGLSTFNWDGRDSSGVAFSAKDIEDRGPFTFKLSAITNGRKVDSEPYSGSLVQSVSLGGTEMVINTKSLGSTPMSEVKQIY